MCTPDGRLPDGAKEQSHLRAIFGRMGFDDREIVALSGAHALGRCHTDRSGFDGPWSFSPTVMSNDYFRLLLGEKWVFRKVCVPPVLSPTQRVRQAVADSVVESVGRPETIPRRGHQIPHDAPHGHGPDQGQGVQETRRALRERRPSLLQRVPGRSRQAFRARRAVSEQAGGSDDVATVRERVDLSLPFSTCSFSRSPWCSRRNERVDGL